VSRSPSRLLVPLSGSVTLDCQTLESANRDGYRAVGCGAVAELAVTF
jgi:hypothetical protein